MNTMGQFLVRRVIRDERGAELVEWVLWVAGLAVVVGLVSVAVGPLLIAKLTTIINAI